MEKTGMLRICATSTLSLALLVGCSDGSDTPATTTSLTVVPTAAPEGAPGELSTLSMRVTLTEPSTRPVVIRYETGDGTATAGEDYLQTAGEVTIAAGDIEGVIGVEILGDSAEEAA